MHSKGLFVPSHEKIMLTFCGFVEKQDLILFPMFSKSWLRSGIFYENFRSCQFYDKMEFLQFYKKIRIFRVTLCLQKMGASEYYIRLAVVIFFSIFWSFLTLIGLGVQWFKNKGNFFVIKPHSKPKVLDGWKHGVLQLSVRE